MGAGIRDTIRVLVLGTGQMGSGICRLLLDKPGLDLVGAYGRRAARRGTDLGPAIGLDRELGIQIHTDLNGLIEQARPDLAIQATCSRLADAAGEISTLVRRGVHVISIAEEMAYPRFCSPAMADRLHQLAVDHQAAILGTGINPGFVLDVLVITLTAVCADIQAIAARRVNDLSAYGPSGLSAQGVGLTPDAFYEGVQEGNIVGHIGFVESIHMIADTLGWQLDGVEERREPIVSRVPRETRFVKVEPGHVAGCFHTAVGHRAGQPLVELVHPQQIHPHLEGVETGDFIEITGTPNLRFSGSPEIPGGTGTIALAVNMIPRVLDAPPGLHSMADLPIPSAMLSEAVLGRWN